MSAGATTTPDGRRMSINVEVLGGSLIVQHYVEEVGQRDHLRLVSASDVFTPTGRTKIGVIWDLRVKRIDNKTCEFTNTVRSSATPDLIDFLGRQGIPLQGLPSGSQADSWRVPIARNSNTCYSPKASNATH